MTDYMTINSDELVPLAAVKRLRDVTEKDRTALRKLGEHVDPDRFRTRLEFADSARKFVPETIDDIARQDVALVEVDERAFVPAANIVTARNLTVQDRDDFEAKTKRPLRDEFKSEIETRAGKVLATVAAETVMHRLGHPYVPERRSSEELAQMPS